MKIMGQRTDLPHFDDSDYPKKDIIGLYISSVLDNDNGGANSFTSRSQQLKALFHSNSKKCMDGIYKVLTFVEEPLPDHSDISFAKTNWRSFGNLLLSIYATAFSAVFLAVAIWQPRYGKWISPTARLTPSTADLLVNIFAKSIEVASAGVYINFLGQLLTKRSLRSRGISLADIAVREWLIQPGFIVWEWRNIKYAGTTILGSTSLLAAIAIYSFTVAANSLVTPHMVMGEWESAQFSGQFRQNFGNVIVLKKDCWAPLDTRLDGQNIGESCINVLASGLANQDFNNFMKEWNREVFGGNNASSRLARRPSATSSIFTDTRTEGTWVQRSRSNITANFARYGRVVNNITLAMPHPVVYYSAEVEFPAPVKGTGFGEHSVKASVVSPMSNTLCVNMNRSEIAPLVYVEWPNARFNTTDTGRRIAAKDWFNDAPANISLLSNVTGSNVQSIFKWGPIYNRNPPLFPQVKINYLYMTPSTDTV